MAGQGQGEPSGKGGSGAEGRCSIEMHDREPCGRPLHSAAPGVDEKPVCLMHSRDSGKSDADFQQEFRRILREAGDGLADFSRFIFPTSIYIAVEFAVKCRFERATFIQDTDFGHATFTRGADFIEARFRQAANFASATFTQKTSFNAARFAQDADFGFVRFMQDADFKFATFTQNANFDRSSFTQNADFSYARFTDDAYFLSAKFTENADFVWAKFTHANFINAGFTQKAGFDGASFTENACFIRATFAQNADFNSVTFAQGAEFGGSTFAGWADFRLARFSGTAQFEQTKFRQNPQPKDHEPGPVFSGAVFEEPEKVAFYRTHLGQALFHNRDVSKINFSDVTWRKRANGKWMVFDEAVDPQLSAAEALRPPKGDPNLRNYRLIEELYQQLKKNYDDCCDYSTAGDFHYGELEMKRLNSDHHNKVLRWLHSNLGLVAWYKYASEYGESYVRPGCWLLAVLILFTCLYPWAGLCNGQTGKQYPGHCENNEVCVSYRNWTDNGTTIPERAEAICDVLGHGAMTALYVAAFQRDLTYKPSYRVGRLLALVETLLTSTLAALFLLAVRRQFKR